MIFQKFESRTLVCFENSFVTFVLPKKSAEMIVILTRKQKSTILIKKSEKTLVWQFLEANWQYLVRCSKVTLFSCCKASILKGKKQRYCGIEKSEFVYF